MDEVLAEAKGVDGQVELLEDKIRIRRKGMLAVMTRGLKGDKEIFISQISSVQYKKAGTFTSGYIQFAFLGGQETKGGLIDAATDENTVLFNGKQQPAFETLKARLEEQLRRARSSTGSSGGSTSIADEIEKLAALKERGILTEEEFAASWIVTL